MNRLRSGLTLAASAGSAGIMLAVVHGSTELAPPKTTTAHGGADVRYVLADSVQDLTGHEFLQSGGPGKGDFPIQITSAKGGCTVKGGYVHGDYSADWTWDYLKTGAHYNGYAFGLRDAQGTLVFDGQYLENIAVDGYRISSAPDRLVVRSTYAMNIRDDFMSYPNEKNSAPKELVLEENYVHTFAFVSWRNTGGSDSKEGVFRLTVKDNVVHLKPQAGTGTCKEASADSRVAGRTFKMDGGGYEGAEDLVTVTGNIFWIEEGVRDGCTHSWPKGRYSNNVVYYSGPAGLRALYLGNVPAGVTVLTGAKGRAAWETRVTDWLNRHRAGR